VFGVIINPRHISTYALGLKVPGNSASRVHRKEGFTLVMRDP
jgi:hypothetical protein